MSYRYYLRFMYKAKYACFDCHKTFRYWQTNEVCPHCGGQLHDMGLDFKAPKQHDRKAWEKIKNLYQSGVRFDS